MNQPRKPKGTPTGGQFANRTRPEAPASLSDGSSPELVIRKHPNGCTEERWITDSKLSSGPAGEPAVTVRWPNGKVSVLKDVAGDHTLMARFDEQGKPRTYESRRNGRLDDTGGGIAARGRWRADGILSEVGHYRNGKLCDPPDGRPASTYVFADNAWVCCHYDPEGSGKIHDPAGGKPARIAYWPDRTKRSVEHYHMGRRCNAPDGGPAGVSYFPSGERFHVEFVDEQGRRHDGPNGEPAYTRYDEDGQVVDERHFDHGEAV